MAKYILKKYIYGKNGLLSHKSPLDRSFSTEVEARRYAYKQVNGTDDTLGLYNVSQRGVLSHEELVGVIYFRDFKSSYPYGEWTLYSRDEGTVRLKSNGTIDRRSQSAIANERESKYRKK